MRNPTFPTFCALGIVLCSLPFPWHWKARNTGTLLYLGWIVTGCTIFFVNSLVWAGNTNDPAPVWCDISSKLILGLSVGMTASSLCINRRLYNIATVKHVSYLRDSRRRDTIIDLVLGIGLPIVVMVLHYIVQPGRYNIIEDTGCWFSMSITTLPFLLINSWPIMISAASFIYASLSIRAFIQTRRQFSRILSDSAPDLNMSRYFRLMALASTEMVFSLPLSIYFLVTNIRDNDPIPWISWEDVHSDFGSIFIWPSEASYSTPLELNKWAVPGGAFLFFLYFGFSGEAVKEYKRVFWLAVTLLGLKPPPPKPMANQWSRKIAAALSAAPMLNSAGSTPSVVGANEQVESEAIEQDITEIKVSDLESQMSRR